MSTMKVSNIPAKETEQTQILSSPLALEAKKVPKKVGGGFAFGHHGEILQGVIESPHGHLRRILVSLKCDIFKSEATFSANSSGTVTVKPAWKVKSQRAVALTLAQFGINGCSGRVTIKSNTPPRWGLGSSTSDVTATIRSVADAYNLNLSPEVIAGLAVEAETASDATMFGDRVVLFTHREGIIVEDFGSSLPPLKVIGFNADPDGTGIDTLNFPPARYNWHEIEMFRPLIGLLGHSVRTQDPVLIGRVASASARINQKFLRKPCFDRVEKIVENVGAVGLQVAHSGTVMGILFNAKDAVVEERMQLARSLLAEINIDSTWSFQTSGNHSTGGSTVGKDTKNLSGETTLLSELKD